MIVHRCSTEPSRHVVVFTPQERERAFRQALPFDWDLWPQVAGPLGARLTAFFDLAFQAGYGRVVAIGSDAPTIPRSRIQEAFETLLTHPVTLGPADDGGFYLIGMSHPAAPSLEGIEWGTSRVWGQTLARLEASGLKTAVLPGWWDVDEHTDLEGLLQQLSEAPLGSPVEAELRRAVSACLKPRAPGSPCATV